MKTDDKEDIAIFNTPLNFDVAAAFPEFTKKDRPKIEYIINQINHFNDKGGYEVHIQNHAWSLCMNHGEITSILRKLVKYNIIKKVGDAEIGKNSNAYRIVSPYDNDTSKRSRYYIDDYLFLQKLKADKWVAKGNKHSLFVKVTAVPNIKDKIITQLKELLLANGIAIPESIINSELTKLQKPIKPKVEAAVKNNEEVVKKGLIIASDDVKTLQIVDYFEPMFEGYIEYEAITADLSNGEKGDLHYELLVKYNERGVNNFSIIVRDRLLNFFTNDTLKVPYIKLKSYEFMQAA